MKKYRGLIFDFNGVLLLDQHLHDKIWKRRAQELTGRELSNAEIEQSFQGRTNKAVMEYLYGQPLKEDDVKKYAIEKEEEYQELARSLGTKYRLASGAAQLLDELKLRGVPITIATSSPEANVSFYNEMLGLDRWFDMSKVVYDDGTFPSKPAPDIYVRAMHALSLKPQDCVVIEDARSGIASAEAAGAGYIIAVGPKEGRAVLGKIKGVSDVVEDLSEINLEQLFW